jgi:hypothetical protein
MAGLNIVEISDFTGGVNFRADQFQLANYESPKMLNVEIDPRGGVFSRGAQRQLNPTAVSGTWTPRGIVPFYGATSNLMLFTATNVYRSTGGDFSTLEYSSGNDVVATNTDGMASAVWGKKLYLSDAASVYRWETGDTYATALTAISGSNWQATPSGAVHTLFNAKHLAVHANKMFAADVAVGATEYPNRVYWSLENSPENWDENDYIEVVGGGEGVKGLAVVSGQLMIFKQNAIYVLLGYDSATFQVVELTNRLGVQSARSIAVSDVGVYFYVHNDGTYFYNGSSVKDMFENIRALFAQEYINLTDRASISLSWVGKRVWLSAPYSTSTTVSSPSVNFVLDPTIRGGVYTMFSTSDSNGLISGCDWVDSSNNEYKLMIHPTEPYVLKVDMYGDEYDNVTGDDVGFDSYYRTRWFDGGSYMQKKMFRRPDVVVKEVTTPQTIVVNVYHNFDESEGNERRVFNLTQTPPVTGLVWGSGLWGENWSAGAISSTILTGSNLGLAKSIQLEFNGPTGQKWGINSIGYKYQARKVKG